MLPVLSRASPAALFGAAEDKDLALAVGAAPTTTGTSTSGAGAYPGPVHLRWASSRCCGTHELAADEVRRRRREGRAHSITFTENPATLGYAELPQTRTWDPLWAGAAADNDVVLSVHLGSSGKLAITAADAPVDVMITLQPMNICQAAADLLWSRIPKHFPEIKIALSEGGTGWIPYFLDRLDRTYEMHHLWTGQNFDAISCRATCSASTSSPASSPTRSGLQLRQPDRHRQHRVGMRLPAFRFLVAEVGGGARDRRSGRTR